MMSLQERIEDYDEVLREFNGKVVRIIGTFCNVIVELDPNAEKTCVQVAGPVSCVKAIEFVQEHSTLFITQKVVTSHEPSISPLAISPSGNFVSRARIKIVTPLGKIVCLDDIEGAVLFKYEAGDTAILLT